MQLSDAKVSENAARMASLTECERDVMRWVALGKLNKVIADELDVSVRTVEVHRARVFSKLGIRSAAELARPGGPCRRRRDAVDGPPAGAAARVRRPAGTAGRRRAR